ncbi:nucleoredoxin-like protein 2 [Daphnia pulex]|uniref:nucleoredoxin-like protein 2 n=1 Tax=Daphnia pulex TaxID=6669 RepID=UPI001EDDA8A9|nr:nucleoredoxin-like protein 2 [Daphnia pulex]XP_046441681.1 nucleoredoxin-like protein 2 [Daphnia pulex]XP_046441687.1 nucleoredoxin-like protein 2 [Daphnia pulex]XP_046441694.1 nucleoredoxin-like protein 2 [Daphnia pulex]XP_046441704.1 nucleoredoxin-like protein 2 [Daphnia pulex]XP_046441712.1 nucleoredoxin-like protein 2 [Daphnia pulex]
MDMLSGQQLVNKQKQGVHAEVALQNKDIICYYFSAHWCPPCRMFTPILADFYRDLEAVGARLECIFVSSDRSENEMIQYMVESHADWLAIPWGTQLAGTLKSKYGVSGIPCLVVVKKDGTIITKDGRSDVHRFGASCFQQWANA